MSVTLDELITELIQDHKQLPYSEGIIPHLPFVDLGPKVTLVVMSAVTVRILIQRLKCECSLNI